MIIDGTVTKMPNENERARTKCDVSKIFMLIINTVRTHDLPKLFLSLPPYLLFQLSEEDISNERDSVSSNFYTP